MILTIPRRATDESLGNAPFAAPHEPFPAGTGAGAGLAQGAAHIVRGTVFALVAVGIVPEAAAVGAAWDASAVADRLATGAGGRGIGAESEDRRAAGDGEEGLSGGVGSEGDGD